MLRRAKHSKIEVVAPEEEEDERCLQVKLGALVAAPAVQLTQQSTEIRFEEINFIQGCRMRPIDRHKCEW
jgi:hypothetical protein